MKQSMSRFKKVKLWILPFLFSETLQELLPIMGYELRRQLDHIHIDIRQHRVADIELV